MEAKGCLSVLLLPVMAAELAFVVNQGIFSMLLVNPLLKRAWRARFELADATAVELTRYPDSLASSLVALAGGGIIPGTEAVAHLFVVGPASSTQAATTHSSPLAGVQPKMGRRISQLRAMGATVAFDEDRRRMGLGAKLLLLLIGGPLVVVFYVRLMLGISVGPSPVSPSPCTWYFWSRQSSCSTRCCEAAAEAPPAHRAKQEE